MTFIFLVFLRGLNRIPVKVDRLPETYCTMTTARKLKCSLPWQASRTNEGKWYTDILQLRVWT